MKKFLNDPYRYVDDMLSGLCAAHPEVITRRGDGRVIARAGGPKQGKVGLVTGGGSGHLPVFLGYVGDGLLDACAVGDVFASPSVEQIADAIRAADGGAGVVNIYGNYGGDVMNFDMASELLELEDLPTRTVLLTDDVASAGEAERHLRRGVAGMVFTFKTAGAAAHRGASLDEVVRVAQMTADRCRSIGVALTPCVLPHTGQPTFTIGDDELEMGAGLHGEPGVRRGPMLTASDIVGEMLTSIFAGHALAEGARVSVLLNSLGATPLEELYIMYAEVAARLHARGVEIVAPQVGRFATSMEMSGASLTLLELDDELVDLLVAPARSPFWVV